MKSLLKKIKAYAIVKKEKPIIKVTEIYATIDVTLNDDEMFEEVEIIPTGNTINIFNKRT